MIWASQAPASRGWGSPRKAFRGIALIVLWAGLIACNEHTALNATAKIDLPPPAVTPTTVELILAGDKVSGPDGQRADPVESGTLLAADTLKVVLKVCKGTPHAAVTQTLQTLQERKVAVAVASADPAHCGSGISAAN